MEENGCDFIVTGEVIGQRPKSQRRDTMPLIARESGAEDRLLRPLTALNLPPSLPEREGWVNREHLYGFHGRNRKPQIELAQSVRLRRIRATRRRLLFPDRRKIFGETLRPVATPAANATTTSTTSCC